MNLVLGDVSNNLIHVSNNLIHISRVPLRVLVQLGFILKSTVFMRVKGQTKNAKCTNIKGISANEMTFQSYICGIYI